MGTQITEILDKEEVSIQDLKGKVLAVDGHNMLYQFLTTIRQRDGTPLKDSHGNVTSHLAGLFSRITNLMEQGLKFVFVFDGEVPELKNEELQRRKLLKQGAQKLFEKAEEEGDEESMKKYASRTARLTKEMVLEARELLEALGVPFVQAPSEGEAQAAHMVRLGDAYALVSQDTDCLVFGTPLMVRNLSVSGRRKKPGAYSYSSVEVELISLDKNLKKLGLSHDQLIVLAMLVGTDYNVGGVKGVGPKKALSLLERHGKEFDKLFEEAGWPERWAVSWEEVFSVIKSVPVTSDYSLEWGRPDFEKVKCVLVDKHDFSEERVGSALKKLSESESAGQRGLKEFF